MQIRGNIAKGLFMALIAALIPTSAFSAQKIIPGNTCKIVNQKVIYLSKTYTCIKLGKKLVWNKGVAIVTSAPTPTPTAKANAFYTPKKLDLPNPITFSNIASRVSEIPYYNYLGIQKTLLNNQSNPGAKVPMEIVNGPNLGSSYYDLLESYLVKENTLYANFRKPTKAVFYLYPFKDVEYMTDLAQKEFPTRPDAAAAVGEIYDGKSCEEANRHDSPMKQLVFGPTPVGVLPAGVCPGGDWAGISGVLHEYSHEIQQMQFWNDVNHDQNDRGVKFPCWQIEGQAVFSGLLNKDSLEEYLAAAASPNRPQVGAQTHGPVTGGPVYWTPKDVEKWLIDQSNTVTCHDSNYFALGYSLGFLTVEALAAIGGPEAPMAWLARLEADESKNQAFSEVFGITWDAAVPILSNVVSQLAMQAYDPPADGTYQVKDQNNIVTITGDEGCAVYDATDPQTTRAKIQVFIDGHWLDVPTIEETWNKDSRCNPIIGQPWLVTLKVALDHGVQYRFQYLGFVNMGRRDTFGRPISQSHVYG
jgi:hypothetical protein